MGNNTRFQYSKYYHIDGGIDEYHPPGEIADNKAQSGHDIHIVGKKVVMRPGRTLWSDQTLPGVVRGVAEFIDASGNSKIIVASDGKLINVTATAQTNLATGMVNEGVHFTSHRGKLFVNGATTQKKYDGSAVDPVGLSAPGTTPTAASGAVGALTGSYSVKVTFAIESAGVTLYESNPYDASNTVALTARQLSLSSVPVSGDTRVTHRYIYRTVAGGSKWFFDGKIADNTTTTYTSTQADSTLGRLVETNHGHPVTAPVCVGVNERLAWLDGNKVRLSEANVSNAYMEYQVSTRFWEIPGNGKGVGLAAVYNQASGRQDLYVFADDSISVLPGGNPNEPLQMVVDTVGCAQHDSIAVYNGAIVFLSNRQSVCMLVGGRVVDLTSRNIPVSMIRTLNNASARGAIIYTNYYALCMRDDSGKLYNHKVWVCDLSRIREVEPGRADGVWYPWNIDAEYIVERKDGTILAVDNNTKRIWKLSLETRADSQTDGSTVAIEPHVRTKNFFSDSMLVMKQPRMLSIRGKFQLPIMVTPYAYQGFANDEMYFQTVEAVAVFGAYILGGAPTTKAIEELEAPIPYSCVGNTFSFLFVQEATGDQYFEIDGYLFTYSTFQRQL
jgi:hypothetical protein